MTIYKMMRIFINILIFLFTQVCNAQKKFTTLIRFPESINTKKVIIEYDDGTTVHPVSTAFFNNKATISGTFYSKYATLEIFPAVLKNSYEGKDILEKMNGAAHTKKGFKAPAFKAKDISGAAINLSKYKEKYVLLTFWASWCGPCLQEMPAIKKIHDSYNTNKLKVISISIDSDSTAFAKAMTTHKMNWINILDRDRHIYMKYGGKPIPMVYLLNKEGIIVYSDSEDRFEVLTDLLSKSIQ